MTFLYGTIFYLLAVLITGTTVMAVTRRQPLHAVLWVAASFVGTALLYYLLGAPLLAAFEVMVYAGGIMVLFLFVVMTLGTEREGAVRRQLTWKQWGFPSVLGLAALGGTTVFLLAASDSRSPLGLAVANPLEFGRFLFREYWFAVEVISFLMFVGLVGAYFLGRPDQSGGGPADGSKEVS